MRRRRITILLAVVCGLLFALASVRSADARPRPRSKKFTANKTFGLGFMFGAPTGLSGKYFLGKDTALDFGVGWNSWNRSRGLHIHADFLWHPAALITARPFHMPIYFGLGGRFWDFDGDRYDDDIAFGLRVPGGIAFDFNNVPLDIFLELAVVLDFYRYYGGAHLGFNGALGIRYYF